LRFARRGDAAWNVSRTRSSPESDLSGERCRPVTATTDLVAHDSANSLPALNGHFLVIFIEPSLNKNTPRKFSFISSKNLRQNPPAHRGEAHTHNPFAC